MSAKSEFIEFIKDQVIKEKKNEVENWPAGARDYWTTLTTEKEKPEFTDNGKLIFKYLQESVSSAPQQTSKEIGEKLLISSRRVAGSMRKLITDGYVEKIGQDPVVYTLTEKGKTKIIND